jgi:hypothetical protein
MGKGKDAIFGLLLNWLEPDRVTPIKVEALSVPQEAVVDLEPHTAGHTRAVYRYLPVRTPHVLDCVELHTADMMCHGCRHLRCAVTTEGEIAWRCHRGDGEIRVPEIRPESCRGYEGVECRS